VITVKTQMNKPSHMNGYRCFACAAIAPADYDGFLCPGCGGNLDITYDYAAVAEEVAIGFAQEQPELFRYQPFLPVRAPASRFPLRIGGTPLYEASRLGQQAGLRRLYLKDETGNPSASLKDRASAVALCRAIDIGARVVSTASTGNAGSSLACLAAALGMQAVVFVPANAPAAKLTQLLSYGAKVLAVQGSYDEAYDLCLAASDEFGWFNRSTGFNPFTREGKKTCSFEIWEGLDGEVPDRVVVPTGDGNILSGIWKGWRDLQAAGLIQRLPKIDCVQSESSAAIAGTVQRLRNGHEAVTDWSAVSVDKVQADTIADSISVDQPRDGLAAAQAIIESGGEAITLPDQNILAAISEMARFTGLFVEPAAAAPWAAVRQMADDRLIDADERVICLVTGSGLKDPASAGKAFGEPALIVPTVDAVSRFCTSLL
jgi:threonine synthase